MLFSERMRKLDVIIIKKYVDDVTQAVLRFGDFETLEVENFKAQSYALKKDSYDEISTRFYDFKRKLTSLGLIFGEPDNGDSVRYSEYLDEHTIKKEISDLQNDITSYNRDWDSLKKRQHDIQIRLNSIRFFGNLDMDLSYAKDVQHFHMGFGSIPSTHFRNFMDAISMLPSVVMNVGMVEGANMVFFTVPKSSKDQLEKILNNVHYKDYGVPTDMKGAIKSNIVKYGFEMTLTHDEEIWLERKLKKLKKRYTDLLPKLTASIGYHLSMTKLKSEMAGTNSVFLFSGWVPAKKVEKITKRIEKVTEGRCLFLDEDASDVYSRDGLQPPTRLENPKALQPFEMLVGLFGTPGYREFDPTIFAAILYVVMYGAMFGDIGHGLVLSALGLCGLLVKKVRKIWKLALLMFWVGISSTVFGFLYGSIFGNEHLVQALWLNPMENIMTILMIAVGFGIGVISLGLILSIVNSILRKEWGRLLFSGTGIPGIAFYWSILAMGYMGLNNIAFSPALIAIPIVAALVIWSEKTLERLIFKHGEKEAWAMGFFEVFEVSLSFMSNTISFLRIGAFALNHAALMSAVFILANMANGPIGKWVTLLIGNIIVIGLEGMIVGIQALRLEFYEFFVKFFRADGRKFEALDIYKQ